MDIWDSLDNDILDNCGHFLKSWTKHVLCVHQVRSDISKHWHTVVCLKAETFIFSNIFCDRSWIYSPKLDTAFYILASPAVLCHLSNHAWRALNTKYDHYLIISEHPTWVAPPWTWSTSQQACRHSHVHAPCTQMSKSNQSTKIQLRIAPVGDVQGSSTNPHLDIEKAHTLLLCSHFFQVKRTRLNSWCCTQTNSILWLSTKWLINLLRTATYPPVSNWSESPSCEETQEQVCGNHLSQLHIPSPVTHHQEFMLRTVNAFLLIAREV